MVTREELEKAIRVTKTHDCATGYWRTVLFALNKLKEELKEA